MSRTPIPKRPRVMQAISHLALGGAQRIAFSLVDGLRDRCDFAVYAALGVDEGPFGQSMLRELEALDCGLYVGTRVPFKFGGMLLAGRGMARAVARFEPDIIHLHTEIPEASYAAMVATHPGMRRPPIVRTIQNAIYWPGWRSIGRWSDRRMRRSFIAAVSDDARGAFEMLRAESGAGALPQPPIVIFNGVSVNATPRPPGDSSTSRNRILFAGRFEDQKGADLLPDILRRVKLPRPCDLVIYGSGTHEGLLQSLAQKPPDHWSVEVHGPVPNLSDRLPEFDLVLMPSRHEGLSLLSIEAALLGVPVIATDGPGVRLAFPDHYPFLASAGSSKDYADVLQNALDNPMICASAARQSLAFAQTHFGLSVMCERYLRLYQQALR